MYVVGKSTVDIMEAIVVLKLGIVIIEDDDGDTNLVKLQKRPLPFIIKRSYIGR